MIYYVIQLLSENEFNIQRASFHDRLNNKMQECIWCRLSTQKCNGAMQFCMEILDVICGLTHDF